MSEIDKNKNGEVKEERGINDLRVCELKAELEKRGLDTLGVKVVLSVRLSKALREEGIDPNQHLFLVSTKGSPAKKIVKKIVQPAKMSSEEPANVEKVLGREEVKSEEIDDESFESQELRIVEESEEIITVENIKQEPLELESNELIETNEPQPVVNEVTSNECSNVEEDVARTEQEATENDEEEEVEGEDEFEEVLEKPSQNAQQEVNEVNEKNDEIKEPEDVSVIKDVISLVVEKTVNQSPHEEEVFLEDEDMLEDPLDEQPTGKNEATKKADSVVTTTEPQTTSNSKSSLLGDASKTTSIWIRGMTPSTKASSVKHLASPFGKVIQSKIFNSKPVNGEVKNCFALVTFADAESMEAAITALHRIEHEGRILRVEKVSDSPLTGSAERIVKDKHDAEQLKKKEEEEAKAQEPKKKREVIQPPEDSKPPKKERQTIQAPESATKNNRTIIQAPERSRSREKPKRERQPIVYEMQPSKERASDRRKTSEGNSRDSRKVISAPTSRGVRVTPPPKSSSTSKPRGRHETSSLIISARVDTSGCRGGSIQRSVERSIPNNITTSELRRNHNPQFSRRVEYPVQSYSTSRNPPPARHSSSNSSGYTSRGEERKEYRDSSSSRREVVADRGAGDRERRDKRTSREQEMLDMLRRKEDEHRMREEELRMERKREQLRFEAEKLERTRLELELQQQKLALQEATLSQKFREEGNGRSGERGSRRRPADDTFSQPHRTPKVYVDDRRGASGTTSQRRDTDGSRLHSSSGSIPSARHVATEYGIQSGTGNTLGSRTGVNYHAAPSAGSKMFDQRGTSSSSAYRTGNSYDVSSTVSGGNTGGYQNYQVPASARYQDTGYQAQVWGGLDANGQMTMETHWTGDTTASASSSSSSAQWQFPNPTASSNRRDYSGYRNNY